ncbi:MAG: ABC transporter ATP-binding protein [Paracoccaceae bacterium]
MTAPIDLEDVGETALAAADVTLPDGDAPPAVPLVSVRKLARRFALPSHFLARHRPVLHALSGVDLEIARGEILCLVGESGCGKTTLGRIVMGLLKPSAGAVFFDGKRIDRMSERRRRPFRARMQMVFQNPYASLNPRRQVVDTLAEPVRHLEPRITTEDLEARLIDVMQATGCDLSWAHRLPHEFSGGQRQRIAIARALVTQPEFLVADEPVSALDVSIQAQILNLLAELRASRGLTYLFITHDLSVVRHIGDRVAVMYLGQIMELAPVPSIFERPQHPYTQLLLQAVPKLEGGSLEALPPPGEPPNALKLPKGCPFAPRCAHANDRCRRERPRLLPAAGGNAAAACHGVEEGRIPVGA